MKNLNGASNMRSNVGNQINLNAFAGIFRFHIHITRQYTIKRCNMLDALQKLKQKQNQIWQQHQQQEQQEEQQLVQQQQQK